MGFGLVYTVTTSLEVTTSRTRNRFAVALVVNLGGLRVIKNTKM